MCPQHDMRDEMVVAMPLPDPWELGRAGDDCLSLNVWTPGLHDAARPVLVWIHGGAFVIGSGAAPIYDGTALSREGAVVVTINYRLGAFGFLHLGPLGGDEHAGNLGQLDQVAALRWVQEHIAAFGGDPDRVTVFGESGGAMSVGTLMAMPAARGLFHRAIAQSGAAHHTLPSDVAATVAKRFCELISVDPNDRDAIEGVPDERIIDATLELRRATIADPVAELGEDDAHLSMPFMPVHGTVDLPEPAIAAVAAGAAAGVDLLVGTTRDESKAFTFGQALAELPPQYVALARSRGRDPEALAETYRSILGERAAFELRGTVGTDGFFTVPAIRLAEAQQPFNPRTWMYRFDWPSPLFGGLLGACHGLDLGFTFGTHRLPDNFLAGPNAPTSSPTTCVPRGCRSPPRAIRTIRRCLTSTRTSRRAAKPSCSTRRAASWTTRNRSAGRHGTACSEAAGRRRASVRIDEDLHVAVGVVEQRLQPVLDEALQRDVIGDQDVGAKAPLASIASVAGKSIAGSYVIVKRMSTSFAMASPMSTRARSPQPATLTSVPRGRRACRP